MKYFTFAAAAAIASMPLTGMAQGADYRTASVKKTVEKAARLFGKKNLTAMKAEAVSKNMKPRTMMQYQYNGTEEEYKMTVDYTYDRFGNMLTYTSYSEDDGSRTVGTYTYDDIETSFITSFTQEEFDSPAATSPSASRQISRTVVERNDKGQVTHVTLYESNATYTSNGVTYKAEFEYGADGKASKITFDSYDDDGTTTITLSDITWEKYDGNLLKIFGQDADSFVTDPANLIKNASITLSADGMEIPGTANGTYAADGKRELSLKFTMMGMTAATLTSYYEPTDANGSYISRSSASFIGESPEIENEVCKFNDHGDITEQTFSLGSTLDKLETEYSIKNEYSYNAETNLADYMIQSELNTSTNEYEKKYKLVYSDYKDVATGISHAGTATSYGKTGIYNVDGMYVGTDLNSLGKGVYIIRQNGKSLTFKK